jgi:hypothetical protein
VPSSTSSTNVKRLPLGIRRAKKHGGAGGAATGRAKSWWEVNCSICRRSYRVSYGKQAPCPRCTKQKEVFL